MRCLLGSSKINHNPEQCKVLLDSKSAHLQTVGGHANNFLVKDGFIIKKTNITEGRFYRRLMNQHLGLSDFVPKCTKVVASPTGKELQAYSEVTIEDLREGFKAPLIYDIKLGLKTVSSKELSAAGSSKAEIVRKDLSLLVADSVTSSARRGYRFVGMSGTEASRFHLGIHPDEMIEHIGTNLSPNDLSAVTLELEKLKDYLLSKEGRRFELIGASVLIVAESDVDLINNGQSAKPKVKIIDFAHSHMAGATGIFLDNGVLHTPYRKRIYQKGLRHGLAHLVEDLRAEIDKR